MDTLQLLQNFVPPWFNSLYLCYLSTRFINTMLDQLTFCFCFIDVSQIRTKVVLLGKVQESEEVLNALEVITQSVKFQHYCSRLPH